MGCSDTLTTEPHFVGEGKEHIAAKFDSIYWFDNARVRVRSSGDGLHQLEEILTHDEQLC